MRLRHIEVFHAVYSSGSVTRAAEILAVSQPSVSKVLSHAEQQLGYRLFDRVKGKLVPTPEADLLFRHVSEVNDSLDRMRHVAENLRSARQGRIRVAATPAFGIDVLPMAIARYRQKHSDVHFSVETLHYGEICAALNESQVDFGLVFDPSAEPGINIELMAKGRLYILAPADADFGGKQVLSFEDLGDYPFINLDRRGPLGRLLHQQLKMRNAQLNTVVHTETYQVAKALVSQGAGITVADEITARSSGHENVRVWPLSPVVEYSIAALHSERAPMSLISRSFVEMFKTFLKNYLA